MSTIVFDLPGYDLVNVLVLPVLMPIIVGLVTTRVTSSGVKAVLLAGLTLVSQLLAEWLGAVDAGEVFNLGQALVFTAPAFAISVATHYGLWKPTGVTGYVQARGRHVKTE